MKKNLHILAKKINRSENGQTKMFLKLETHEQAELLLLLSKESKNKIINHLSDRHLINLLEFLDEDDGADILQTLAENKAKKILKKVHETKRNKIKKILRFDPKTAGGLMDLNYVLIKTGCPLNKIAAKVDRHIAKNGRVPLVVMIDEKDKVIGFIPYKNLILKKDYSRIEKLTKPLPLISHSSDHDKVLKETVKNRTDVAGVIDEEEKLLGIIHLNDLLKIIEKQSSKDLFKFAGVHKEEEMNDKIFTKVRHRYRWLIVNLATAFLAASVVAIFESTIAKFAILAIYMPIIAGEGGNAGTQALAVAVRGLANNNISKKTAKKVILKEALAGTINGIIIGVVVALVAILFNSSPIFGLIVGTAMVVNLFVAGFFGAATPFFLKRLNIDPATASSIFVTTATDVFGFFTLLGLGSLLLH